MLNEWDAQALEEALLLKDAGGAEVVAVGLADDPEIEQILYRALAKGVDAAVKLTGAGAAGAPGPTGPDRDRAAMLAEYLTPGGRPRDHRVQAPDEPDGHCRPGLPPARSAARVGGHRRRGPWSSLTVRRSSPTVVPRSSRSMPASIGVQSGRQAPRYAPITRIKQAMRTGVLTEIEVSPPPATNGLVIRRMHGGRRPEKPRCQRQRRGGRGSDRWPAPCTWPVERVNDKMSRNVMVLAEHTGGQVSEGTYELIGIAHELASELGGVTEVVLQAPPDWPTSSAGPTSWSRWSTLLCCSTCPRRMNVPCPRSWRSDRLDCC